MKPKFGLEYFWKLSFRLPSELATTALERLLLTPQSVLNFKF
jgi:hypothetical protein